jgi:hypothetical protein
VRRVATIVVQFSLFERTSISSFDIKKHLRDSLSVSLNLALQIFKHEVLILTIFLKFKNVWTQFKNNVWFLVHINIHQGQICFRFGVLQ